MFVALYIALESSRLEGEVLIQWNGGAGEFTEAVIAVDGIAVSRNRVCSVARSLGRLDGDIAVTGDTGTGRDELTAVSYTHLTLPTICSV